MKNLIVFRKTVETGVDPCQNIQQCWELLANNLVSISTELKQRQWRRQQQRQKSSRFKTGKTITLNVDHVFFLYISLPSLHDYDLKVPNFTFYGEREHKIITFFFFSSTSIQTFKLQRQKKSPTFDKLNEMK